MVSQKPETLLIILCGLPYSGKTTLGRALEESGAVVVELDHINRARGFEIENGVPMSEWPETVRQAEAMIDDALLKQRRLLVLSWVNPARQDRLHWQEFAASRGMRSEVVYIAADLEVLDARASLVVASPDRHVITDALSQRVRRRFQAPTSDEATVLDASWAVERQVAALNTGS